MMKGKYGEDQMVRILRACDQSTVAEIAKNTV